MPDTLIPNSNPNVSDVFTDPYVTYGWFEDNFLNKELAFSDTEEDLKIKTKNEKSFEKELKKEDSEKKGISITPKKKPKKIAKSIFSKIKSLTSKKTK